MIDKISSDVRIYTDVQSLEQLRGKMSKDPVGVKKEVAKQFEAMLMQMVLKSMRDASKVMSSGLYGSDQMELYEDLFDKQMAMVVSGSNSSLSKMIEKNIDQQQGINSQTLPNAPAPAAIPITIRSNPSPSATDLEDLKPAAEESVFSKIKQVFKTKEEFVNSIWSAAKQAATLIGVDPQVLVAQAALETDWGKKIIDHDDQQSSHNLFNIKADAQETKKTKPIETIEQKDGLLVKEKSFFKSYDSFVESFIDYVSFLKNNLRYGEALQKAANPQNFVHALQNAGFATDNHYADKIMSIFSSSSFKKLMTKVK